MTDHHVHAGGHGEATTIGVHGMLLFGEDPTYLSHLPMFDTPHNFQVLLEVAVDDAARKAYRPDEMHTFVPEPFPIAELDPSGGGPAKTTIDGAIFGGHFERGGTRVIDRTEAQVRQVVYFAELNVDAKHDVEQQLTYLCFGRPGRLFLAHRVTARPDFDHVLSARLVPESLTDQAGRPLDEGASTVGFTLAEPISFERPDTAENRLASGEAARGLFFQTTSRAGFHGFFGQMEPENELYLEVDELR
jgi:hypothetical protein